MIVIQSYGRGLDGVRSANPEVKLRLERDPTQAGQRLLHVEYPAPGPNPAGRDVWCDVEQADWTSGRAISFRVKAGQAGRISVSFLDRNRVAYTHWVDLQGDVWETVRIPFDRIRPNPYFQPPGANTAAPIDVGEVTRLGFAPQTPGAGQLTVSAFVVE